MEYEFDELVKEQNELLFFSNVLFLFEASAQERHWMQMIPTGVDRCVQLNSLECPVGVVTCVEVKTATSEERFLLNSFFFFF